MTDKHAVSRRHGRLPAYAHWVSASGARAPYSLVSRTIHTGVAVTGNLVRLIVQAVGYETCVVWARVTVGVDAHDRFRGHVTEVGEVRRADSFADVRPFPLPVGAVVTFTCRDIHEIRDVAR